MDAVKTGALIAQARKDKGYTQRELAEKVYVSVQAVSKWELGKNFPDLALMEPLAETLDLTVTELLSGQRGEEPGEETVRSSLRFGLAQLGPKIRRWKWLFIAAAALLLALGLGFGYVWVRDSTEWLPQRETTVRELDTSSQEHQIASALGSSGHNLHLYEVCLADDVTRISLQAELWTYEGMVQSWRLMDQSSGNIGRELFGPRRQLMVLNLTPHSEAWSEEEDRWTEVWFDCGISFLGFGWRGELDTITNPYINGGSCWGKMEGTKTVDQDGTALLTLSLGGSNGGTYAPGGPLRKETVELVIRMYCE